MSALAKIEELEEVSLDHADLQKWSSCWPKLMEGQLPDFSEPEQTAMTMAMVGMLIVSVPVWSGDRSSFGQRFDQAMEKCAALK